MTDYASISLVETVLNIENGKWKIMHRKTGNMDSHFSVLN